MRGRLRRALCAAAGTLAFAGAAHAAAPVLTTFDAASLSAPGPSAPLAASVDLSQVFALPTLSYGPPSADRQSASNITTSVALVSGVDLTMGYKVNLAGRSYDSVSTPTFNGLFLSSSAQGSSYASLTGGGDFVGATVALADDLHVTVSGALFRPAIRVTRQPPRRRWRGSAVRPIRSACARRLRFWAACLGTSPSGSASA